MNAKQIKRFLFAFANLLKKLTFMNTLWFSGWIMVARHVQVYDSTYGVARKRVGSWRQFSLGCYGENEHRNCRRDIITF